MSDLIEDTFEKVEARLQSARNQGFQPPLSPLPGALKKRSQHSADHNTEPLPWDQFCKAITSAQREYNSRGIVQ